MNTLRQDIRQGFRTILANPGLSCVAVLSLALGIGANTTIFAWIQTVLLNPLPGVATPSEMVVLVSTHGDLMHDSVSYPDLKDYAELKDTFQGVIGSQITPALMKVDGRSDWLLGQIATANFFDVLGVRPVKGRTFLPEEDLKPGGHPVLVISCGLWQRRFGGDPNIVGRTIELNQRVFTIVGVAPAGFSGTMNAVLFDFWAPLMMYKEVANFGSLHSRTDRWLHTQARLRPGLSIERAQAAVNLRAKQLEKAYPRENAEIGMRVLPMWKAPYGGPSMMLQVLQVLIVVSGIVLLIVAANVANLLLVRATGRRKEIAIRMAIGAGRGRLVRQMLTESIVLAGLGGAVGVLTAYWAVDLFTFFIPKTHLPIGWLFRVDATTLGFTLMLTLVTGILFGLAPALQSMKSDLQHELKEGGRTPAGAASHHRLRSTLVVSEIALAVLLLVGAGLCIKGSSRATRVDFGFNPDHLLAAGLRIGANGYTEETGLVFYKELRRHLADIPGVSDAGMATWFPLGFEGGPGITVEPEGYGRQLNEDMSVPYVIISPGYFATMRIPILAGRDFTDLDDSKTQRVAIINDNFARRFWPGQETIGRHFRASGQDVKVVGVVKSGKYRSLNEAPRPFVYLAYQQGVWDLNLGVVLRARGNPEALVEPLRRAVHEVDPDVEVWATLPMIDYIKPAYLAQKITSTLLVILGVTALLLASMGIYGVMAYVVNQRRGEYGIRMALGAEPRNVLGLVLRLGLMLAGLGIAIGLAGALALTRLLANFLYGVSPFDPATFAGVVAVLALVSFLACYLPAHRAIAVDPISALRHE